MLCVLKAKGQCYTCKVETQKHLAGSLGRSGLLIERFSVQFQDFPFV